MEVRQTEDARKNVEEFATRLLNLQQQKKLIDQDIKAIKEEYKEEGVPVSIVSKAINKIKAAKKKSESEKFEEDVITDWLEQNAEIDDKIGILIAKY